jgi:hypothetical protein
LKDDVYCCFPDNNFRDFVSQRKSYLCWKFLNKPDNSKKISNGYYTIVRFNNHRLRFFHPITSFDAIYAMETHLSKLVTPLYYYSHERYFPKNLECCIGKPRGFLEKENYINCTMAYYDELTIITKCIP